MLTIAICDDDEEHLHHTAAIVRREFGSLTIGIDEFLNADGLRKCLAVGDYSPDIAILDIELGEENGIDLAKEFNRRFPDCRIIFLSGYPRYISASYEAEHVWFVLKSQADTYLGPALHRARTASTGLTDLGVTVKAEGRTVFIPLHKILYIVREQRRTVLVCTDGSYRVSTAPHSLITPSVADAFLRCHQSYWVNLNRIDSLDRSEFVLSDGKRIPIGRTYRDVTVTGRQ